MTPLHLAAQKHKLNSAHLLVEAGANRHMTNEAILYFNIINRQKPIDLCGNDPPMLALLDISGDETKERTLSQNAQVLTAAKDLLESTLVPVTAAEETIILACQKVTKEANQLQKAKSDDYAEIQQALVEHRKISEEFKEVITQVEEYRNQLAVNRDNVSRMGLTLAETQREVSTQLHSKRTSNAKKRSRLGDLETKMSDLTTEYDDVCKEIEELTARISYLTLRKSELEDELQDTRCESSQLMDDERSESRHETDIATHEESLQATRSAIEKDDQNLNSLQTATSDRLLNIGMEYATFLRKYKDFINELKDQFDTKIKTMENRIEEEKRNYDEVSKLQLKMDPSKLTALINEYQLNLARFQRRKDKILAVEKTVTDEFAIVKQLVGEFGREVEPLD